MKTTILPIIIERPEGYIMNIQSLTLIQKGILIRIFGICRTEVMAWISYRRLAEECGCSRRWIMKQIKPLEGTWLIVHKRGDRGKTNMYRPSARLMTYLCQQQSRAARRIPKGNG